VFSDDVTQTVLVPVPSTAGSRSLVGELLLARRWVTTDKLERALQLQVEKGDRVGKHLVDMGAITPAQLTEVLAQQVGMPFVEEINPDEIDTSLVADFTLQYAREHNFVPLRRENGLVVVAVADPIALNCLDDLHAMLGTEIDPIAAPPEQIFNAVNRVFDRRAGAGAVAEEVKDRDDIGNAGEIEDLKKDIIDVTDDEAPIIRLVNSVLNQAVKERASDIHIEPYEKEVVVRLRKDGILSELLRVPKRLHASISSRIKIMGELDIAEKRLPQDGRIQIRVAGRDVDIRLSTVPTGFGERLVMRLLDKSAVLLDLEKLGFDKPNLKIFDSVIHRPHGIVLVTGPTGSGKTTTLYAALSSINRPEINILTVEDPIEYQLPGIGQMQVNPKIEFTFARGLRAILRQDPDVVLIGEIRDRETAEIAVQASLTGHLVLATLHTNDAASSFTRLIDMGVEPFLLSSSVIFCMAQRLARRLHAPCKVHYRPPRHEVEQLGISMDEVDDLKFFKAGGCSQCRTGYAGRAGLYELLLVNDEIRSLVTQRADSTRIKRIAIQNGMRTLRDDGAMKVLGGLTSVEEVMSETAEDRG